MTPVRCSRSFVACLALVALVVHGLRGRCEESVARPTPGEPSARRSSPGRRRPARRSRRSGRWWSRGRKVDVYTARVLDPPFAGKEWDYGGPYGFASFDTSGPVEVRISCKRPLADVVIRPLSAGVRPRHDGDRAIVLPLDGPRKLSIEPDGKRSPLLLFANPIETDAPGKDDPGVVYFGPGVHKPEKIELGSNQTLYLAGGAVVKAEVLVEGENIRIRGRGILDGSDWEWRKGPVGNQIAIRRSSDVEIRDIVIRGLAALDHRPAAQPAT